MVFSSITFLFYFLPIVIILYYLAPSKLKNTVLFFVSLCFYAWGEPKYILLMIFSIIIGYVSGILTEKLQNKIYRKLVLFISLFIIIGLLGYFKYTNFFLENLNRIDGVSLKLLNITLPIGISFYTFQIISYEIDVYRGKVFAQKNPLSLALYVTMFPQLIAGPIVRYADIATQLEERTHDFQHIAYGIRRFILGLGKKVLLADVLAEFCENLKVTQDGSVLYFWLYAISISLYIYLDFSGYSDMAIGLGSIFGFHFPENFYYPFCSKSITEFWRRWHISLGSWFRDYVYIPMGGNRVGRIRGFFHIFIVWMLTGFWHGANWNFIVWGLYFSLFLIVEKIWLGKQLAKHKYLSRIYVLFILVVSFVIFNETSMGQILAILKGMSGCDGIPLVSQESLYFLKSYGITFLISLIAATPLTKLFIEKLRRNSKLDKAINALEPFLLLGFLFVITAYLVAGTFHPFLYFRF